MVPKRDGGAYGAVGTGRESRMSGGVGYGVVPSTGMGAAVTGSASSAASSGRAGRRVMLPMIRHRPGRKMLKKVTTSNGRAKRGFPAAAGTEAGQVLSAGVHRATVNVGARLCKKTGGLSCDSPPYQPGGLPMFRCPPCQALTGPYRL